MLDIDFRIHDVNNLYVVDGCLFSSNSVVSPALTGLTIIANALRVGNHLIQRSH